MSPQILLSHPFGNANVRHAALALAEAGLLREFHTCIQWPADNSWGGNLPDSLLRQLQRRTFPDLVASKTRTQPVFEAARLLATRFGWQSWIAHERGPFSIDAICRRLDEKVARVLLSEAKPATAVYGYEDCAVTSFSAARQRGIRCLYDLPIGYWQTARAIQSEEALRQPEWAATLTAMIDSPQKLARKDGELRMADAVFVASQFTASTLREHGWENKQIHIIPYGCPEPIAEISARTSGPLRVLFAGSLGQRKGTSYLLTAIARLGKHVELTLLGSRPDAACTPLDRALQTHRWIPSLPHAALLEEMRRNDVLVFPSLFEGFGLVITEALSCGLPVITTPNTGGPDLLTEGEDGYVIPIRDEIAIAEKLEILIENRKHLQSMKAAALQKAKLFTWEKYRSRLRAAILDELT